MKCFYTADINLTSLRQKKGQDVNRNCSDHKKDTDSGMTYPRTVVSIVFLVRL